MYVHRTFVCMNSFARSARFFFKLPLITRIHTYRHWKKYTDMILPK